MVVQWVPLEKPDGKPALSREEVLVSLRIVIDNAFEKANLRNTQNGERIKWNRVVIQAGQVAALVLRDADLDDLQDRIEQLEKLGGNKN